MTATQTFELYKSSIHGQIAEYVVNYNYALFWLLLVYHAVPAPIDFLPTNAVNRLDQKMVSSAFFWHEIECEIMERNLGWYFKGKLEDARDDIMKFIKSKRRTENYAHPVKDCSQMCKERARYSNIYKLTYFGLNLQPYLPCIQFMVVFLIHVFIYNFLLVRFISSHLCQLGIINYPKVDFFHIYHSFPSLVSVRA